MIGASWLPTALKIFCFFTTFYCALLSILLLAFNVNNFQEGPDHIRGFKIACFVVSVVLFVDALVLLAALFRNSRNLLTVWISLFIPGGHFQVVDVCFNLYYYIDQQGELSDDLRSALLSKTIVMGALCFVNIFCVAAVHRYRQDLTGI